MTIFKESKSGIAFINYIDQEGKRRKKSTGLPYTKENIRIIEKNVFPRLKEKLLGKNVDENISVIKQYTVKEICLLFLKEKESPADNQEVFETMFEKRIVIISYMLCSTVQYPFIVLLLLTRLMLKEMVPVIS